MKYPKNQNYNQNEPNYEVDVEAELQDYFEYQVEQALKEWLKGFDREYNINIEL